MTRAGFEWKTPPTEAFEEAYTAYIKAVRRGVKAIADKWAPFIQNWMRDNAPWTDRTGNARQALHTEVHDLTTEIYLMMAHGVEYGIHLEIRNSGKYAIIAPAVDEFFNPIWKDVKAMMGR